MENVTDLVSPEETTAPAAGLFSGMITRARCPTPTSVGGFLSEIERMPHFGIPSEESFVRNFLKGRKVYFVAKS
ncbi:hypothetical protein [Parasphingorhabdus sp.]|uniref:hypothetical protein n=1 Tax=Parasphingorhabdus sp. TaxID=2709688 RepID=UPI00329A5C29